MEDPSDDDATCEELTVQDLFLAIADTHLGEVLIGGGYRGTIEQILGQEVADVVLDKGDDEDPADGEGIYHADACPRSFDNGIYTFVNRRACTCESFYYGHEELLDALPDDKVAVVDLLIKYGSDAIDYLQGQTFSLRWEHDWYLMSFAQRLDELVLPICRDVAKTAEIDTNAMTNRDAIFDALLRARKDMMVRRPVTAPVYFFHSLAALAKCQPDKTFGFFWKLLNGRLPPELVVWVREVYYGDKEKKAKKKEEEYYETMRKH